VPDRHLRERRVPFSYSWIPVQLFPVVPDNIPERVPRRQAHTNAKLAFATRDGGVDEIVLMAKVHDRVPQGSMQEVQREYSGSYRSGISFVVRGRRPLRGPTSRTVCA